MPAIGEGTKGAATLPDVGQHVGVVEYGNGGLGVR
jgi:hypothetical protein